MQDSNLGSLLQEKANDVSEKSPENNPLEPTEPIKRGKKPVPDLHELVFIRLIDPIHIPSYLVEQMPDRLFDVEKFYQFQKLACLYNSAEGTQINPINLLYAIVHEKMRQVKGFLWMTPDYLTNSLTINWFSFDKEYWQKGEAAHLIIKKAKELMKDLHFSRIVWLTKNPRFCEDNGFRRSREHLMIYEE